MKTSFFQQASYCFHIAWGQLSWRHSAILNLKLSAIRHGACNKQALSSSELINIHSTHFVAAINTWNNRNRRSKHLTHEVLKRNKRTSYLFQGFVVK